MISLRDGHVTLNTASVQIKQSHFPEEILTMELLFLLCSVLSTALTSLVLSLLLPFQIFRRKWNLRRFSEEVTFYEGTVWHERRRPVRHSFRYTVRYALIDLDRATKPPENHFSAAEARRIANTNGPVLFLTIPPSVGYEQNPLSLYYCYDLVGSTQHLTKCIAEVVRLGKSKVTNTPWGERASFVFNPNNDLVAKSLHVSPFMDMLGNWKIHATSPGDNLMVTISVQHPKLGDFFTATLKAKKITSNASDHALFFWLMPHKVSLWIYWHAFILWWKNVAFIQHPRYSNSMYREEAKLRDQKLKGCTEVRSDKGKDVQGERSSSNVLSNGVGGDRCFAWRDAPWPWS
ncbi:Protein of unknown function DUF1365 [Dillenia turbinata]|uniref:DUF1365 domain-containing protein n=1 Tax=Dillenia turbinata TaxID=194707 RepID=A0AAN8UN27_9MAGN